MEETMDPLKDIEERNTMTNMAGLVATFYRGLIEEGVDAKTAEYLAGQWVYGITQRADAE